MIAIRTVDSDGSVGSADARSVGATSSGSAYFEEPTGVRNTLP